MSYRTVAVELEDGRVRTEQAEGLPRKAKALLTILETPDKSPAATDSSKPGLLGLLDRPDFPLTAEQFRASMDADFWDQ